MDAVELVEVIDVDKVAEVIRERSDMSFIASGVLAEVVVKSGVWSSVEQIKNFLKES